MVKVIEANDFVGLEVSVSTWPVRIGLDKASVEQRPAGLGAAPKYLCGNIVLERPCVGYKRCLCSFYEPEVPAEAVRMVRDRINSCKVLACVPIGSSSFLIALEDGDAFLAFYLCEAAYEEPQFIARMNKNGIAVDLCTDVYEEPSGAVNLFRMVTDGLRDRGMEPKLALKAMENIGKNTWSVQQLQEIVDAALNELPSAL